MAINKKWILLTEAILSSLALMVFSYFIHSQLPFRLLAIASLSIPAWIFSRNLRTFSDPGKTVPGSLSHPITLLYILAGILSGVMLAIFYRRYLEIRLFPLSFHLFMVVAALIGCTEELVFRGFIQDLARSINGPFSIFFSSISHTAYKCCLFLSPGIISGIDIGFLAAWTFIGGILLGTIKHFSKSIVPSMIAHALFDILVYAEFANPPWWVW